MAFICASEFVLFGCKFNKSVPVTPGVGGPPAFYRKVQAENNKTEESRLYLLYTGSIDTSLAYRLSGRTITGLEIKEDVIITTSEVLTTRGDFRHLDKVERLSSSMVPLISGGLYIDGDEDGHIDLRDAIERPTDGVLTIREGGAGGVVLVTFENAAANLTPDARDPAIPLYGEEILVFEGLYYSVINDENVPYYQKVFLLNRNNYAINNGTISFESDNISPSAASSNDGFIKWGLDPHNNDDVMTSDVKETPRGIIFNDIPAVIPGLIGNLVGSMDINEVIGVWLLITPVRPGVINFNVSMITGGISNLRVEGEEVCP